MSALTLTLIRLAFLGLLWAFVLITISVLRSDLRSPSMGARTAVRPGNRRTAAESRPRGRAGRAPKRILITQGSLAGTSVPLRDQPITIGRAPDSTIVLDDDYVSYRHAQLTPDDKGRWVVEDLGSTNGTYIDRQRITGRMLVGPGVSLRIGKTVLELRR